MSADSPLQPREVFARRVREARDARGFTQRELATRLTERGYRTDRTTVVRIETGKKADVSLSDAFAFALALDVRPIDLIVPLDDEAALAVTPDRVITARKARAWIRGDAILRGANWLDVFSQRPKSEQRALVREALTRSLSALEQALLQETIEERTELVMQELHEAGKVRRKEADDVES